MTTNKKLVVTVGVMAVALILALTGIIVVLVSANQRASSAVNVKYTASDVYIRLSAKAYVGGANGTTYTFRNGDSDNLVLSPTFTEGSLSQVDDIIELSKSNPEVVFEYKFENMTEDIDAYIDLDTTLNESNIGLKYAYSAINQVTDFDTLSLNDTYDRQALCAGPTEDSRVLYIYIVVSINDLLYDAELAGTFDWNLGKSDAYRVDINDTNS